MPNLKLFEGQATWANSAAADTEVDLDIEIPKVLDPAANYLVIVRNPSTETAVTVRAKNKEFLAGADRYPEVQNFNVPVSSPDGIATLVSGWLLGTGARLTLSNDTGLSAGGGFVADVLVRQP